MKRIDARARSQLKTTMCFFCRHVRRVTSVTIQPIMVTRSKVCVVVAKCERMLTITTATLLITIQATTVIRDRSHLATMTRTFYVVRNGLQGYQCYRLHMTTQKYDKIMQKTHIAVVKCEQPLRTTIKQKPKNKNHRNNNKNPQ